jgi:Ser/Thr protein kinase RdoA (MazF antagonist)
VAEQLFQLIKHLSEQLVRASHGTARIVDGELEHLPRQATLRAALIAGYRSVRPLSAEQEAAVDDFVALWHLQLALWAVGHREQPMFADSWKADLLNTLDRLR